MIWTNKYNLPKRIIRQLPELHKPKDKRISVTDLINPPRIRTLQLEKWDEIVMDYSDLLDTIIGLSVHERQSKLATSDDDSEHKFEDTIDGVTLVGKSDNYDMIDLVIRDTKTIPVDRLKFPDFFHELELQLNLYAYQRRLRDQQVKGVEADLYFRDWKRYEAEKDVEKWAVMKKGRKSAVRLFNHEHEAWDYIGSFADASPYSVEHRQSTGYPQISVQWSVPVKLWSFDKQKEYVADQIEYHVLAPMECPDDEHWKNDLRCKKYCRVRSVCPYAKELNDEL